MNLYLVALLLYSAFLMALGIFISRRVKNSVRLPRRRAKSRPRQIIRNVSSSQHRSRLDRRSNGPRLPLRALRMVVGRFRQHRNAAALTVSRAAALEQSPRNTASQLFLTSLNSATANQSKRFDLRSVLVRLARNPCSTNHRDLNHPQHCRRDTQMGGLRHRWHGSHRLLHGWRPDVLVLRQYV